MNKEQQHSPKYWVVHSKLSTDVMIHTSSKNKSDSISRFLDHTFSMVGTMSEDELEEWWENQTEFVCSLVEIKLVEV